MHWRILIAALLTAITLIMPAGANAATIMAETDKGLTTIYVMGDIEIGDDDKFRKFATQYPQAEVALWSKGGSLIVAIEIGRMVHINRYSTVVIKDYECASACALIWIAGSERKIQEGGKVGFHAGYREENGRPIADSSANAIIGGYLNSLNLPMRALVFATSATPETMYWLDTSNPGVEGINYETFSGEESPSLTNQPLARSAEPQSALNGKSFGKWTTTVEGNFVSIRSSSTEGNAAISYYCFTGKACKFALMLDVSCDPGDHYTMFGKIEGYEIEKLGMTCDVDGQILFIDNSEAMRKAIDGETRMAFGSQTEKGKTKVYLFSLIGFGEGYRELVRAGNIVE